MDYVKYIVVSEKVGNPNVIDDIRVVSLKEVQNDLGDKYIIVAMKPETAETVKAQLKSVRTSYVDSISAEESDVIITEIIDYYKRKPLEKNKIFFFCYHGQGYKCNCKYIAERLLAADTQYKLVWAVSPENDSDVPAGIKKVYIDTKEYYEELYTSKFYIANDGRDGRIIKKEGQYCINTWHGYGPFKKVNTAISSWSKEDKKRYEEQINYFDLFLTASSFYTSVYRDSFLYHGEVMESGAPRNDLLFSNSEVVRDKIYRHFNIPNTKKILLYAPTFRLDKANTFRLYDLKMKEVLIALEDRFGGEYVLMYRFHHQLFELAKERQYEENGYNATFYEDIQELLVAADVVITDYSSLMWDFSLQRRPVFLYQNDINEYEDERGFYAPVEEWPYPKAHTQQELIQAIAEFDQDKYRQELDEFLKKYGSCDDGHAAQRVVNRINEKMKE